MLNKIKIIQDVGLCFVVSGCTEKWLIFLFLECINEKYVFAHGSNSSCANYFNSYTDIPTKVRMSNRVYSLYMADPWWT